MKTDSTFSNEKEVRIMMISMIPMLVALFGTIFYFLYLKTIGSEVPVWFFGQTIIIVLLVSSLCSLTLNEILLKILLHERTNLRRLVFRCVLLTSYFSLMWTASFLLSLAFPWAATFFQFFYGTLLATAIFVIIVLRFRQLFNRLDKGDWHL